MPVAAPSLHLNQHHHPTPARPWITAPTSNPFIASPSTQSQHQLPSPASLVDAVAADIGSNPASSSASTFKSHPATPPSPGILYNRPRPPVLRPRPIQRDLLQKPLVDASSQQKARRCPVCFRRDCRLISHKLYAPRLASRHSQHPITDHNSGPFPLTASIGNARIDPFFDLPIGKSDPEMQRNFRDFFTTQLSSMTNPVRIRAFDAAYSPVLLRQALADPALCHTFIAMSATYSAIHGRGLQAPDAKLLSIYSRTFKVLRRQISQVGPGQQLDTTIMATINLMMYDALAFGDKSSMAVYPATLKNLVDSCGGLSNLNAQPVGIALWCDLYVTLYTGSKPVFLDQVRVMPDIPLSNPPPAVYGAAWDDLAKRHDLISPTLLDVCLNTCRLTELLEDRVSGNTNAARWEYFHYKRNAMAMRNGTVHAELSGSGTKAECISLVHNLFVFLVLRLMPWKAPLVNLCEQLQTALSASGAPDNYWDQDGEILLWVLFTLLAGADYWDGKRWALELLRDTLAHRYGTQELAEWPPDWREMQHRNLVRFTWSDIYLAESFRVTCGAFGGVEPVACEGIPGRNRMMPGRQPRAVLGDVYI